ncbi:MAG: ERCC4 domain-containing protein [archaeon]
MKEIFNIFPEKKKSPEKLQKNCRILVDYREKNCFVATKLIKNNFEVEFKELKVADYIVRDVAIERKTVPDFMSSMLNKRLKKQIEEIQQYKNKLLIIEGIDEQELYPEKNGINPNAIRGFLLSILLKHKIPVLFTKNQEDTAKFISVLANKRKNEISLNAKKKSFNKKEQMQFIIESFPGIGPVTAKKLLEKFNSIKKIINAPEEELKEILGKKAEIFKIVEEEY